MKWSNRKWQPFVRCLFCRLDWGKKIGVLRRCADGAAWLDPTYCTPQFRKSDGRGRRKRVVTMENRGPKLLLRLQVKLLLTVSDFFPLSPPLKAPS